MKVAILGSGISGLTAAWYLQSDHDVVVFEANDYVGGHTNTVTVHLDNETHSIDTGFIVFNDWTYPNFIRLLTELGVDSQPTTMSFSVRDDQANLEYSGTSLATLFAQKRNLLRPHFYRLLADILRFNRTAIKSTADGVPEMTVGQYLNQHRYSDAFTRHYLLPMGAAIWSCPTGTFADFPIRFVVEFYRNHGLLSITRRPTWRVISGGSQTYVRAMIRKFRHRIRLNTPIRRVVRTSDSVWVYPATGKPEIFDHVIFACHSDQALNILGDDATTTERDLLQQFPYKRNVAVLHTDESVLPKRRRVWASWNYRIQSNADTPPTVSYNMNLLQGIHSRQTFCVTLNDESSIAPERILRRFEYQHPVFTTRRTNIQSRHVELLNAHRTSFCGAYWGNGFHEDGVNSALAVVKAIQDGRPQPRIPLRQAAIAGVTQ